VLFNAILKCVWFIVITHYVGNLMLYLMCDLIYARKYVISDI
jgi:hypothetical protein